MDGERRKGVLLVVLMWLRQSSSQRCVPARVLPSVDTMVEGEITRALCAVLCRVDSTVSNRNPFHSRRTDGPLLKHPSVRLPFITSNISRLMLLFCPKIVLFPVLLLFISWTGCDTPETNVISVSV